jgi:hypothetical protein
MSEENAFEDERSFTINQFCALENISRATFFKLGRRRLGPELLRVPGTNVVRITGDARRRWHQRLADLSQQEAATLEHHRRVALASRAGRAAAMSPRHISKRPRRNRL